MHMTSFKGFLGLLLLSLTITAVFFPVSVYVHEGTHYLMYTLEGIPVISFHVLDQDAFAKGACGYVMTLRESQFGTVVQEAIAYGFQFLFMVLTLLFCLLHPFKAFTIRQLSSLGLRKNAASGSVPSW